MADWFKFYNDGLDEARFQYAISVHPEVIPVWLLILSEASRHYSGTFPWRDADFELFGYSRKIGVSVPLINQCLNLLVKIEYISKDSGCINILKWNDLQSEYCQGKAKGRYKSRATLPIVSRESPIRVEESRRDKKRVKKDIPPVGGAGSEKQESAHAQLIRLWTEAFKSHHKYDYVFQGGKDGSAAKRLLLGANALEIVAFSQEVWNHSFRMDNFLQSQSVTLNGLSSRINEFKDAITRIKAGTYATNRYNNQQNPRNNNSNRGRAHLYAHVGKIVPVAVQNPAGASTGELA